MWERVGWRKTGEEAGDATNVSCCPGSDSEKKNGFTNFAYAVSKYANTAYLVHDSPKGTCNGKARREGITSDARCLCLLTYLLFPMFCLLTRYALSRTPKEFEKLEFLRVLRLGCNDLTGEPRCHEGRSDVSMHTIPNPAVKRAFLAELICLRP